MSIPGKAPTIKINKQYGRPYILTPRELTIMKILCDKEEATVQQIFEKLRPEANLAYTTIQTQLRVLEDKGFLIHRKSGRSFKYKPLVTRQQSENAQVKELVDLYFDGEQEKLIKYLKGGNLHLLNY